ncbi:MAG: class II aldolase/adducin family protein [Gemmatimonadota bacterium]
MGASSIGEWSDGVRAEFARGIVSVCRRLYDAGLIAGQDGNVSVRLPSDTLLVTPAGASKCDVTERDLIELTLNGEKVSGAGSASSEILMHLRIYARRPDVRAVVHAHPPTATGFGVAGHDLMDDILPEAIFSLGGVPLVPYATPGTPALSDAMEPFLANHDGFLLANHGATTVGPTLQLAHQRMESLEHAARILVVARSLGRVNALSASDGDVIRAARAAARRARELGTVDGRGDR